MSKDSADITRKRDDLESARIIRDALDGFSQEEQERILRWAAESLGILPGTEPVRLHPTQMSSSPLPSAPVSAALPRARKDVATFVNEKNPQTDIQLAATIAYYYRFEAPEGERRDAIDASFLRDALRLAGRPGQLVQPLKTLNNAHGKGLLDRGSERGTFVINSVGENLVGMTLPGDGTRAPRLRQRAPRSKEQGGITSKPPK